MSRLDPTAEELRELQHLRNSKVAEYLTRALAETTDTLIGTQAEADVRTLQGQARLLRTLLKHINA